METLRNAIFVPHGAPTFALDPGPAGVAMSQLARQLPTPRAIIVVSPHWDTAIPTVSTATQLETIYDFYGFPEALYRIKYPATGCPEGAQEVVKALQKRFGNVATDENQLACLHIRHVGRSRNRHIGKLDVSFFESLVNCHVSP